MSAVHNGQLTIEPMPPHTLLQESKHSTSSSIPGLNSSGNNILCALCGTPIFPSTSDLTNHRTAPPSHPSSHHATNSNSWSTSLFKRPSLSSIGSTNSPPISPRSKTFPSPRPASDYPHSVYVFRVTSTSATGPTGSSTSAHPLPIPIAVPSFVSSSSRQSPQRPSMQHQPSSTQSTAIYPLCTSGWCLARLRTTCTMWAFVRTGIVEKIWEEEVPVLPPPLVIPTSTSGEKPPIPPRRRGLWSMASALGEKAVSWGDGDKSKKAQAQTTTAKNLPATPPPIHPSIASTTPLSSAPSPAPPLPKRSGGRGRAMSVSPNKPWKPASAVTTPPVHDTIAEAPDQDTPASPATAAVLDQEEKKDKDVALPPTHVPLPESRPSTPVVPPRTASPAPGAQVGAPPPIPRRAAARGSQLNATRPVTPIVPVSPILEEKGKTEDVAAQNVSAPSDEVKPVGATEADIPKDNSPSDVADNLTASPTVNGDVPESVDQNPKSESPVDKQGGVAESEKQLPVGQDVGPVAPNHKLEEVSNGDVEGDAERDAKQEDHEDDSKGNDNEVYIGDTTWEERTWKELVRLKEDMFWARVGGLR